MKQKRWSMGRIFGAAVALLFAGLGAALLVGSHGLKQDFKDAQSATLADAEIDLSKPSQHILEFDPTYRFAHGINLMLRLPGQTLDEEAGPELLQGLTAKFEVRGADGTASSSGYIHSENSRTANPDKLLLLSPPGFDRRDRRLVIEVLKGAPALAGTQQHLELRYHLCGCERLSDIFGTWAGIGLLILGGATATCAFPRSPKKSPSPVSEAAI